MNIRHVLFPFLFASLSYAASQEIVLDWRNGFAMPGTSTELVPVGYFTGNSQNVVPNLDGTCAKRPGRWRDGGWASTTSATKDTNLSVNLMANLSNSLRYWPRNWGLVAIDDRFYKRNNENRTWTQLTTPAGLVTDGTDDLQATEYYGELIVGGDISALAHFDGDSLFRLVIPMPYDSTAGTGDTTKADDRIAYDATTRSYSKLDSGSVHWYAWTWTNRQGYETALSGPIKCPALTATALKCSLGVLPLYPPEFGASIDTVQLVKRNIYCSVDSGGMYKYVTSLPPRTTTFIDSGQYNWNIVDITGPADYRTISAGRYPVKFQDQMWFLGPAVLRRSPFALSSSLNSTTFSIDKTPAIVNTRYLGKCMIGTGAYVSSALDIKSATFTVGSDNRTTIVISSDSKFIDAGVVAGDYAMAAIANSANPADTTHATYYARVASVVSNTELILEGDVSGWGDAAIFASLGNNTIQIDSEIIGIAGSFNVDGSDVTTIAQNATTEVGARGLFGTTAATHASGTPIYFVDPNLLGSPMYKSLVYAQAGNPVYQINAEDPEVLPVKDVTGLFVGNGFLGITGTNGVYALRGTSEYAVQPVTENIGNVAPRAIVPYLGGAFVLDDAGVYHVSDGTPINMSRALGTMLRDSAATGYYEKASAGFHRGKLYLSTVHNGTTKECFTYVADVTRATEDDQPIWTRYTGWNPRSFAVWDSAGVSDLYFGEWDSASVFKIDPAKYADASSMTTTDSILVQVDSPTLRIPGSYTTWKSISLTLDTNDSVTVIGTFSNGFSTFTQTLITIPKADSSSAAGQMREHNFDINQAADTFQFTVKQKSKTSRFVLGPVRVYLDTGRRR